MIQKKQPARSVKKKAKANSHEKLNCAPIKNAPTTQSPRLTKPITAEQERQSGKPARFEIFALGRWDDVRTLAHFFGASGFGSGFGFRRFVQICAMFRTAHPPPLRFGCVATRADRR